MKYKTFKDIKQIFIAKFHTHVKEHDKCRNLLLQLPLYKWTDKDMMQFICQTGMDAIKHIKNCALMDQFFKRHGMTDSVNRYNRNIDFLKTGISIGSGVGEGPASWEKVRLLAVEDIKRYCNAFLNGTVPPLHVPRQSEPIRTSQNESNWSNMEEQVSFTPAIKY